MGEFRPCAAYIEAQITQDRWIEYHHSIFVVTVVSVLDLALILVNAVYQFGLSERACRRDTIMRYQWVEGTAVEQALREIERAIEPFRSMRNIQVHQGEAPNIQDLIKSDLFDLIKLIQFTQRFDDDPEMQSLLDEGFREEIDKLIIKLRADRTRLRSTVLALFDALLPVYRRKGLIRGLL